ncbi:MAG: hypothetical protein UX77_C0010G0018 [Parcubacteria group bacterium GW2011_GWA1_47_11]|nr:MAG: hypothetical protein UX77_C0010G0018 [Parcubacteria group bacterium GW2011_GWA1_47_11]
MSKITEEEYNTRMEEGITSEQLEEIGTDFIRRLDIPDQKPDSQFIIVVGGAPGSGKTTAANRMAKMAQAVHVQANSARFLLAKQALRWGENVHKVVRAVLEKLLSDGHSVILDGMITDEKERQMIRDLAAKGDAKSFFIAITCQPDTAQARARARYADNKESSFEDWRAGDFEAYLNSIPERAELLQNAVNSSGGQIEILRNNGSVAELESQVNQAWSKIKTQL